MTKNATIQFQARYGLTQDGIIGSQTWGKMKDFMYYDYYLPQAYWYEMTWDDDYYRGFYVGNSSSAVGGLFRASYYSNTQEIAGPFTVW